jgi:acetyl-CoA C-acetyltransferase
LGLRFSVRAQAPCVSGSTWRADRRHDVGHQALLVAAVAEIAADAMTQLSPADPIVILSYARTPMGAMQGALAEVAATDLGAIAVKAAVERAGVSRRGHRPRLHGLRAARRPRPGPGPPGGDQGRPAASVEATTVNKVCGSGMQTVIMGAEALAAGTIDVVVAGGMESMTNAPYLLKKHRSGARIGHDTAYDHMFLDGLEDAYEPGRAMGTFAQDTANAYQMTREEMDAYSIESLAAPMRPSPAAPLPTRSCRSRSRPALARCGRADEAPGKGRPTRSRS